MRIKDVLGVNKKGISFEFFPPKSLVGYQRLKKVVSRLEKLNPLFYSVTETGPSDDFGLSQKELALYALEQIRGWIPDVPAMLHYTCFGLSIDEVNSFIGLCREKNIESILALRGPKAGEENEQFNKLIHANELIEMLSGSGAVSVGGAVYPETHPESHTITKDRSDTLKKIRGGMDFAITQLFFDNRFYYDFGDWLLSQGIDIPVIPGILTDFSNLVKFCHGCGGSIPSWVLKEMAKREGNSDSLHKYSVEFATKQIDDLQQNGVRYFHLYTINKDDAVIEICRNLPSLVCLTVKGSPKNGGKDYRDA